MNDQLNLGSDPEYRSIRGPLYHYTSLDAFLGIVESQTLWATSAQYMNDASELVLGIELMRKTVLNELKTAEGVYREFLAFLLLSIEADLLQLPSIFVLCFSEHRNDLSQWRSYSPHGRSVCIGFDTSLLVQRMQELGWQFQAARYDPSSQQSYVNAILMRMRREALAHHDLGNRTIHFSSVIEMVLPDLLQVAAMIKHAAFRGESEIRFMSPPIAHGDPRIKFRAGRSTLIPYIEFDLVREKKTERLTFAEILIGPSPSESLTQAALLSLLRQHEVSIDRRHILLSGIPYREL